MQPVQADLAHFGLALLDVRRQELDSARGLAREDGAQDLRVLEIRIHHAFGVREIEASHDALRFWDGQYVTQFLNASDGVVTQQLGYTTDTVIARLS